MLQKSHSWSRFSIKQWAFVWLLHLWVVEGQLETGGRGPVGSSVLHEACSHTCNALVLLHASLPHSSHLQSWMKWHKCKHTRLPEDSSGSYPMVLLTSHIPWVHFSVNRWRNFPGPFCGRKYKATWPRLWIGEGEESTLILPAPTPGLAPSYPSALDSFVPPDGGDPILK
jgi:hypothetical protein